MKTEPDKSEDTLSSLYLPDKIEVLQKHFYKTPDDWSEKFKNKAAIYNENAHLHETHSSQSNQKEKRQLEKDEPIWTMRLLIDLWEHNKLPKLIHKYDERGRSLTEIEKMIGQKKNDNQSGLQLFFEVNIQPPDSLLQWMVEQGETFHPVPYMQNAFRHNQETNHKLEGSSQIDAIFMNRRTGFILMIEAKYLSDCSVDTSFHPYRNQIIRNLDILMDISQNHNRDINDDFFKSGKGKISLLENVNKETSYFALLTPDMFHSDASAVYRRYYSYLFETYKHTNGTLANDLPHIASSVYRNSKSGYRPDFNAVRKNMMWFTFNAHSITSEVR